MTPGIAAERLYLVDAHALLFQVFHAIPEMSSPGGLPTNALFGFTRDMLFLRKDREPGYLVVVFDPPGKTFRDGIYPAYKAQRGPMPATPGTLSTLSPTSIWKSMTCSGVMPHSLCNVSRSKISFLRRL